MQGVKKGVVGRAVLVTAQKGGEGGPELSLGQVPMMCLRLPCPSSPAPFPFHRHDFHPLWVSQAPFWLPPQKSLSLLLGVTATAAD